MEDKQLKQDNDLKELFKRFNPELSSDKAFLSNLEKSLNAIDLVKEHSLSLKRKNYIALAVAFIVGLIMGVGLSLLFPLLGELTTIIDISFPSIETNTIIIDWKIVGWLLVAVTCFFTAKNAYDITLYKLNVAEARQRC